MSQTLIILIVIAAIIAVSCATLRVPSYKGELSDHFDGKKFHNTEGKGMGNFRDLMKYNRKNKKAKWEVQDDINPITSKIEDFNEDGKVRYYHINHATVLIQMDGVNIITDPVYSERASPFNWAGPKRFRNPGIPFEYLPRIDAVVISHDHYDHLDISTLKRLKAFSDPRIFVGLGLKQFLKKFKVVNVEEMDWGDKISFKGVDINFTQAIHWSNRAFSPRKTLWGGYAFQGSSSIYFAGDTAYGSHFKKAKETYGPFDLALIPIGAYTPRSFMLHVHMDPQQGAQTHIDLDPRESLAIHWGTFQLTHEGMYDPTTELSAACDSLGIDNFLFDLHPGVKHETEFTNR